MTEVANDIPVQVAQELPVQAHSFSINDYIDWFEKVNINTLIWQIIALILLVSFRKEIKGMLSSLINKIPQLKSLGMAEFELSNETKEAVEKIPAKLLKEIQAYEVVADKNPNIVFLTIFIDIESKIREICTNYYLNDDLAWLRASPTELIQGLIRNEILDQKAMPIFQDIRGVRNKIAHGEKPFRSIVEAQPYFEALILLKEIVYEGLEKVLSNKQKN